jgi:hypothetical protein
MRALSKSCRGDLSKLTLNSSARDAAENIANGARVQEIFS